MRRNGKVRKEGRRKEGRNGEVKKRGGGGGTGNVYTGLHEQTGTEVAKRTRALSFLHLPVPSPGMTACLSPNAN